MAHGYLSYEDNRGEGTFLGDVVKAVKDYLDKREKKEDVADMVAAKSEIKDKEQEALQAGKSAPRLPMGAQKMLSGGSFSRLVGRNPKAIPGDVARTPEVRGGSIVNMGFSGRQIKPDGYAADQIIDISASRVDEGQGLDRVVSAIDRLTFITMGLVAINKEQTAISARQQQFFEKLARKDKAFREEQILERQKFLSGNSPYMPVGAGGSGGGIAGRRGLGGFGGALDTFQTGLKTAGNPKALPAAQKGVKYGQKAIKSGAAALGLKSGRTVTKKLAQTGAKTTAAKTARTITKKISGDALPLAKVLKAGLAAADDNAIKAFAKSGVTGAGKNLKAVSGYEALAGALQEMDADDFARMQMEEGTEAVFRNLADDAIQPIANSDDAFRAMAAYKNGSLDGIARNTDEAMAMFKYTYGDDVFAKYFGKNATKPIKTALKGTATEQIVKQTGKRAAKITAKNIGKSIWKKIPVIAGIAGIGFGIQRAMEGDLLGAGLEITSGLMGATGVAAKGSLAIDGYLLARDLGLTPLARGGIVNAPVSALIGERGKEGVFPLEGSEGQKTFMKFGEGILTAQKRNKDTFSRLQAAGLEQYFQKQRGFASLVESFKDFFGDILENFKNLLGGMEISVFGKTFKPFGFLESDTDGVSPQSGIVPGVMRDNYDFGHNLPPTGTGDADLAARQQYGAPRDHGTHSGQDFDIVGPDATFESQIGGKVMRILNDPGGYGKYVDIYNKDLDVTERIAEGAEILVKVGDEIAPGTPVTRGETRTGVIHYEIRKGKAETYGFAGTLNPMDFLREHTGHDDLGIPANAGTNISPNQVLQVPDDAGFSLEPINYDQGSLLNSASTETMLAKSGTTIINNIMQSPSTNTSRMGDDVSLGTSSEEMGINGFYAQLALRAA